MRFLIQFKEQNTKQSFKLLEFRGKFTIQIKNLTRPKQSFSQNLLSHTFTSL